jgi:peptidoglycan/xylan/chitin deacetylase (PgdA/CDA1 family)
VLAATLAAALPGEAASAPAPQATVLRCGKPADRRVALTFDDGPNRTHTRHVLAILRRHNAKATFFVLGASASRNPDLVKQIATEGHLVASHSWDHPKRISLEEWRTQIQRTREAIRKAGVSPSAYLRPPHGIINKAVKQACAEQGLTIVLYTLLSSDWTLPGKDKLVRQVVGKLAPGGIVVLHDGGGDRRQTVEALPEIIRGLRGKGLELARLDELLGQDPKVEECARK